MATITSPTPQPFAVSNPRNGQRRLALERANATRTARRQVKQRLTACGRPLGAIEAARIILSARDEGDGIDVGDLLLAVPGLAKSGAHRMLNRAFVSPWKPIDELTERQAEAIAERLHLLANQQADTIAAKQLRVAA